MSYKTKAKDIMTTELIVGRENITIEEAIKVLVNNRITGFPIVDSERRLVGVLSEFDVMKAVDVVDEESPIELNRQAEFSRKVRSVDENASFRHILKTFVEKKVRRLPVINEEGRLLGIITRRDIMKVLFYKSKAT